ncbi:MAG: HDOD domain-containing protein, partial [Pseudomonadota bacterium]
RLPAFASSLVVKLLDENVSPGEVSEMVKEDPALVALVLKTVNSPFYGFKKSISDIHHAIVLLGFNEVYQLVVAEGVSRTMPDTPIYRQLQMHSLAVSHLAFAVSQESGLSRPAQAATVGLLHELGRSIIRLLKDKNPNLAMLLDGLDPAQIGALLLKEWNLPEVVWRCIEYQFHPEFSPPTLIPPDIRDSVAVIYLSHLCHDRLRERPYSSLPTVFLDDYKKVLGWEGLSLDDVIQKRLLPSLTKKINTFPASFRSLIKKGTTPVKAAAAADGAVL